MHSYYIYLNGTPCILIKFQISYKILNNACVTLLDTVSFCFSEIDNVLIITLNFLQVYNHPELTDLYNYEHNSINAKIKHKRATQKNYSTYSKFCPHILLQCASRRWNSSMPLREFLKFK